MVLGLGGCCYHKSACHSSDTLCKDLDGAFKSNSLKSAYLVRQVVTSLRDSEGQWTLAVSGEARFVHRSPC